MVVGAVGGVVGGAVGGVVGGAVGGVVGGVCVILKQDLKMFSPVELELDLLDLGDHIRCNGKVVWNIRHQNEGGEKPNFYDIGIEFVDISGQDRSRLEHIINRLVKNNG